MLNTKPEISRVYKDIDLTFSANVFTGDVDKVFDVKAVKQSLQTLLFTAYYERLYHPEIGSPLAGLLFEPVDPLTAAAIGKAVEQVINNYEPRCVLQEVLVNSNEDNNSYNLEIRFFVRGVDFPEQKFVSTLYRAR